MKRIIAILSMTLILLTGCTPKPAAAQEEVRRSVCYVTVKPSEYSEELTLSGNVVPIQTVKLSFKLPGVVSDVMVKEGDYVTAGQVIATMDQSDYRIKSRAANAEYQSARLQVDSEIPARINQAKAQYELTKTLYDRVKNLYGKNAVTQSQLDEITAKLTVDENTYKLALEAKDIAETKLKMAEASMDYADSNVRDTIIYSPVNGVVLKKLAEAGEAIAAGYPTVVIGQVDRVWIETGVPDGDISSLRTGQKAEVYVYGMDKTYEGIVDEITSLADTKTRTFSVKILVDNTSGELKSGMISRVDVKMHESEKLLVPLSSIIQMSTGPVLYIYSDEKQTAVRRTVETGEITGEHIEITGGLEYGEKVIVEGQSVIRDGDRVAAEEMTEW